MQQNHRDSRSFRCACLSKPGQRQFNAGIRTIARFEAVNILGEITAQLCTEQCHGE